jgi:hypothetical protein
MKMNQRQQNRDAAELSKAILKPVSRSEAISSAKVAENEGVSNWLFLCVPARGFGHTGKQMQTLDSNGGRCRIRTCDFHRVKMALYR